VAADAVLFDIWIELNLKKGDATLRKEVCQKVDEIRSEYGDLRKRMAGPARRVDPAPTPDTKPTEPEASLYPPPSTSPAGVQSPFKKDIEEALHKAQAGMTLNLRELARALGYSYSVTIEL